MTERIYEKEGTLLKPKEEIIRCKDCKFNKGKHKCFNPNSVAIFPSENDFCSYGKPKEEGDG